VSIKAGPNQVVKRNRCCFNCCTTPDRLDMIPREDMVTGLRHQCAVESTWMCRADVALDALYYFTSRAEAGPRPAPFSYQNSMDSNFCLPYFLS
jgi:hypothetical protein